MKWVICKSKEAVLETDVIPSPIGLAKGLSVAIALLGAACHCVLNSEKSIHPARHDGSQVIS